MGNCQRGSESELLTMNKLRNGPIQQLDISCVTWNKDYQGLFDYESKEITKKTILVKQNGAILKMNNDFKVSNQLDKNILKQNADKFLFKFVRRPDSFYIQPIVIQTGNYVYQKSVWMIVKSTPDKMYSLREGDIIKLGRQRIRVKQKILADKNEQIVDQKIVIQAKQTIYENLNKIRKKSTLVEGKQQTKQTKQTKQIQSKEVPSNNTPQTPPLCRICLDPGAYDNPLITPCKCAGSMKYIHLICLQMWLGKRLNPVINHYSVTINWKPLLCELCTSHFLYKIYLDNKRYYTVQIPRPAKPYLVLEVIHRDKTKKKVYHLVSFAQKKKLNLGRKHDTDVKISDDISVSRNHSSIRYDQAGKQFIIQDFHSKFGTLILVKKRLVVRQKTRQLSIQVGPNVFQFEVRRGFGPAVQEQLAQAQEQEQNSEQYEDEEEGIQQEQQVEEQQKQDEQNIRQGEMNPIQQNNSNINIIVNSNHISQNNNQNQNIVANVNNLHPNANSSQVYPMEVIQRIADSKPTVAMTKKSSERIKNKQKKKQEKQQISKSPNKQKKRNP